VRVVIDDNLADLGGKMIRKEGDVAIFTGPHDAASTSAKLIIDMPGEYEVGDVSIYGIAAQAHMDEPKTTNATMYKIYAGDVRLVVTGHIYPELSEKQLETIGTVDVMVVPVGGNGYTVDPAGALQLSKKIEPKVIVPTHYSEPGLSFPVPQRSLDEALKELSLEPKEGAVAKYKPKAGVFDEGLSVVVLSKS
jgi:L-ascorbate metabolism protein UlaG (beta-lactamase superfamily)